MRQLAALLVVAASLDAFANGPIRITTVILVRHAEKVVSESKDPALSTAGTERARELARVLTAVPIDAVYTTPFARTRQTAAPLASTLGVEPVEMKTGAGYAAEIATRVRETHAGQTILVVGHSNSTPDVMRALGVRDVPSIPDSQYDDLFVVTLVDGAEPKLVALRYGAIVR